MNAKLQSLFFLQPRCAYLTASSPSSPMICGRALGSVAHVPVPPAPPPPPPSHHSSGPPVKLHLQGVSGWNGLEAWRSAPTDERRVWGRKGPVIERQPILGDGLEIRRKNEIHGARDGSINLTELASWGELVLVTTDPLEKAFLTHQAFRLWAKGDLQQIGIGAAPDAPGRPPKPELVPPREVPPPKETTLGASAHLLHNLAHIELNAIDLAWDTVVRFSHASEELGKQFFADFLHVADDESRHFRWCQQRLNELGFSYGDMPAHNLLWKDCLRTSGSVKSRLAVIPMMQICRATTYAEIAELVLLALHVTFTSLHSLPRAVALEARGLDAGPRLVKRLLGLGDQRSAAIVQRIGEEEVAHVGIGVFWFLRVCERLQVDPGFTFKEMMEECNIELHGPFNHEARAKAGLLRHWYDTVDKIEISGAEEKSHVAITKREESGAKGDGNRKEKELAMRRQEVLGMASKKEGSRKEQEGTRSPKEKTVGQAARIPKVHNRKSAKLHTPTTESPRSQLSNVERGSSSSYLPEIYERLALLVAMEKDNAGLPDVTRDTTSGTSSDSV